jgi:hypothetical protein
MKTILLENLKLLNSHHNRLPIYHSIKRAFIYTVRNAIANILGGFILINAKIGGFIMLQFCIIYCRF